MINSASCRHANQSTIVSLKFYYMKLQVHSIHFDADQKLIDFIQNEVDKLETFYDRLVDGEVFLRIQQ